MKQSIFLHATGSAFLEDKYDLRTLELILSNYRQLIDQIVILDLKYPKLTQKIKNELIYQVTINPGSLDVILDFFYKHKEDILSLFLFYGGLTLANFVSKMISAIIELRRIFTSILERGLKPTIKIEQNINIDNSITHNINTDIIQINDPKILIGAGNTKKSLDRLIRGIDGEKINNISLNIKILKQRSLLKIIELQVLKKKNYFQILRLLDGLIWLFFLLIIEALYHYRDSSEPETPFMVVHGILAKHLNEYPELIKQKRTARSKNIFGQVNACAVWEKVNNH